jgi:hypothetical protein
MSKLKIENINIEASESALKAILTIGLVANYSKFVNGLIYTFYIDAVVGDCKPDDNEPGYWIKHNYDKFNFISIVDDNYDFVSNNSVDISSIENWDIFGYKLIGSVFGFKDFMSLRSIIKVLIESKCGGDYSTFESTLNNNEKGIAYKIIPTKIVKKRGYIFFSDQCGGDEIASNYVESYIGMAELARKKRYLKFVLYVYSELENSDGLKAEKRVRENQLLTQFVERGVMKKSDDDVDGLSDWLNGTSGTEFENDSLINSLNIGTYTLNDPGLTKQQFVDNCIGILENGLY